MKHWTSQTIKDVENFWNANPLFTGECDATDSYNLFEEHNNVYFNDVFSGINYQTTFLLPQKSQSVLDVGCGIGFWLSLFQKKGVAHLTGIDLSQKSIAIAKQRVTEQCQILHGNAESLPFASNTFDHVNCQGVVHHTPNTQTAINEIFRVTKHNGTVSISVYYDNILLKSYVILSPLIRTLFKLVGKNMGRGRDFSSAKSKDELTRLYDGESNPIGKSYSKKVFKQMLQQAGFQNISFNYFFFPFRFFSFPVPKAVRPLFVKLFPFMIVANMRK